MEDVLQRAGLSSNWRVVDEPAASSEQYQKAPPPTNPMGSYFQGSISPTMQHDAVFVGTEYGTPRVPTISLMPVAPSGAPSVGSAIQSGSSFTSTAIISTGAAGSTGQVQFNNGGGAFGASSLFAWDNINNILTLGGSSSLGIGTTSAPRAPLEVNGAIDANAQGQGSILLDPNIFVNSIVSGTSNSAASRNLTISGPSSAPITVVDFVADNTFFSGQVHVNKSGQGSVIVIPNSGGNFIQSADSTESSPQDLVISGPSSAHISNLTISADHSFLKGDLTFDGSSSGSATVGVAAVAGAPNKLVFPTATATPGDLLSSDGGTPQQLSWVAPSTGTGVAKFSDTSVVSFVTPGNGNYTGNTITIPGGTLSVGSVVQIFAKFQSSLADPTVGIFGYIIIGSAGFNLSLQLNLTNNTSGIIFGTFVVSGSSAEVGTFKSTPYPTSLADYDVIVPYAGTDPISGSITISSNLNISSGPTISTITMDMLAVTVFI